MAHPPGERRVRVDLAERNAEGLREHAGLELAHAREIDRHREKTSDAPRSTREAHARRARHARRAWAEGPWKPRRDGDGTTPRSDASILNLPTSFSRPRALGPERPQDARRERARRLGREELLEHPVDSIHRYSSNACFRIALPRAS
jgi:hypothetical protein